LFGNELEIGLVARGEARMSGSGTQKDGSMQRFGIWVQDIGGRREEKAAEAAAFTVETENVLTNRSLRPTIRAKVESLTQSALLSHEAPKSSA
jgi:hypothetical protein